MVTQRQTPITQERFEAFIQRPENANRRFELIEGEIFEVPSNPFASFIAGLILTAINLYLREHPIGYATTADGGYYVNGQTYAPDVAFIRKPKRLARQGFNPEPPDLAVEVISDPTNQQEQYTLRVKIQNYQAAGAVVWVVNPETQTVEIYEPGQMAAIKSMGDTITWEAVLPGFALLVAELFPEEDADNTQEEPQND